MTTALTTIKGWTFTIRQETTDAWREMMVLVRPDKCNYRRMTTRGVYTSYLPPLGWTILSHPKLKNNWGCLPHFAMHIVKHHNHKWKTRIMSPLMIDVREEMGTAVLHNRSHTTRRTNHKQLASYQLKKKKKWNEMEAHEVSWNSLGKVKWWYLVDVLMFT